MLYLVRHCQAGGQEPDAPLTALGRQQAAELARHLQPTGVARIVTSTFLRARESAEPLASLLGLPVVTDERLTERILSTELLADWRERLHASWADHDLVLTGGESSRAATARGMAAIEAVLADGRLPAVVVSHGNLISLLLHAFDGRPGFAAWEALTNPDVFQIVRAPADSPADSRWSVTRHWPT